MEKTGYERSLLVFNQSGIIDQQDSLVTDFSHDELVWDVSGEYMQCVGSPKHLDIIIGFF